MAISAAETTAVLWMLADEPFRRICLPRTFGPAKSTAAPGSPAWLPWRPPSWSTDLPTIRPFRALRPASGRAAEILAPPYDVLSSAEARERAKGKPLSFLHVSKPEIDLDPAIDPYDRAVYAKAAENFQH